MAKSSGFQAACLSDAFLSLGLLNSVVKSAYKHTLERVTPSRGSQLHFYALQILVAPQCKVCMKLKLGQQCFQPGSLWLAAWSQ